MDNGIYNIDYREGIKQLDDKSVKLFICDPPYWHHKSPGKPYSQRKQSNTISKFSQSPLYNVDCDMMKTMSDFDDKCIYEMLDILTPKCIIPNMYFFCSESQVPYYCKYADDNNLLFSILVWHKPLSIINKNRFSQNLEYIVRIYTYGTGLNRLDNNDYYDRVLNDKPISGKNKIHPTQKPYTMSERFILLNSNENDLIVDCFAGSGSTLYAAKKNNRRYIGFELNQDFYKKAKENLDSI